MSDAMNVAQQRRDGYLKAIAQKESEIAQLKEHLEDLDNFLEFGQSLLGNTPAEGATPQKIVSRPLSRPTQPTKVEDKKPDVGAKADDDEWGDESAPKESIARVLASRTG